jgi:hypothetical protein
VASEYCAKSRRNASIQGHHVKDFPAWITLRANNDGARSPFSNYMGSSFIDFKDYGFWSRDIGIEVWLYLLVREINTLEDRPDWLEEAREHWLLQAKVGFGSCISPDLDYYLVSQDRIDLVVMLSERALKWLHEQGEHLSYEYLKSLGIGSLSVGAVDIEVEVFDNIGRKFIELLIGELKTTDSTSSVF